jgi:DivIVA domain-containing protein
VSLDRQSIEKKDFPVGRRGYDPDAVDAHLSALADEIDELTRSTRRRTDTLAMSASEQVRAIVEAAENSANEIARVAETEAQAIREEASNEAHATRDRAAEEAREYVGKVSTSTNSMLERIDGMKQELSGLIESLRTAAGRLNDDLRELESNLGEVSGSMIGRPRSEPGSDGDGAAPGAVAELDPQDETAGVAEGAPSDEPPMYDPDAPEPLEETTPEAAELAGVVDDPEPEHTYDPEYTYDPDNPDPLPEEGDDAEGARLIALNMALNGTPREETARYLTENFQLSDAGGLLDEVYASVEG